MGDNILEKSGIYQIVCKINNHTYYGSAISFKTRFRTHKNRLIAQTHENSHLQNAWNKYGQDNFVFIIILVCSKYECIFHEQQYLNWFWDNGINCYNISPSANSTLGTKRTDEYKHRMSIKAKQRTKHSRAGAKLTDETKKKISIANTGKTRNDEWKAVKSENMMGNQNHFYGKQHSPESLKIMSASHMGQTPWNKGIARTEEERNKISATRKLKRIGAGSRNPNSKYTDAQIILVKTLISQGVRNKDISIITGVSINTIEKVNGNKTWMHIKI